jgi:8-oxo-dGTP pyrophosphatase MutT (NUDIX family)
VAIRLYAFGLVRYRQPDSPDRYLCLFHCQKKEHPWRFGGGKIEPGELPIVAAIRECYEEIRIIAKSATFITKTPPFPVDGDEWSGYFYMLDPENYIAYCAEPDKISEIAFFTKEEMFARDMHPEYEVVLELERQEELAAYNAL